MNGEISLNSFYAKFNEDSYYNAFLRVKKALLDAKLIKISGGGLRHMTIEITDRGRKVWALLEMVLNIIGGVAN